MQPRLDLLTLAVADLQAARRFYRDGLGCWEVAHNPGWSVATDGRVTIG